MGLVDVRTIYICTYVYTHIMHACTYVFTYITDCNFSNPSLWWSTSAIVPCVSVSAG